MTLAPQIEGMVPIRSSAPQFLQAFHERVIAGLLTGKPAPRSNYVVGKGGRDHLEVRAADWWTAISVGLNELELRFQQPGLLHYRVRYWRWAGYALGLGGALGLIGLILLLGLDVRGYIERHPDTMLPGFSIGQNLAIAWVMVVFWGFVWPWLLIALHKRPLGRLVARLVREVDATATSNRGA